MEQLKKQLICSKKQLICSKKQYFEATRKHHIMLFQNYQMNQKIVEIDDIPLHIINEYKSMMDWLKIELQCPICYDLIGSDNLKITNCGHKYCDECYKKIDTCAVCRREIKK